MSDDETDKELDLDWIDKFEEEDKVYNKYELCQIDNIEFVYIYTFKEEIININKEIVKLSIKNKVKKEEQLYKIIKNLHKDFSLMSILIFNINIKNIKDIYDNNNFFKRISIIDDINLDESLSCLKDLNSIYFIFKKKEEVNMNNMTKKIYYKPNNKTRKLR